MQVILYKNTEDPRTVYKHPVEIATVSAIPFYPIIITTPVFKLSVQQGYDEVNYCYVPEFHRFYFIDSVQLESGNAMILKCSCDVLNSFKTDISNLSCVCTRNEYEFNKYIQDDVPSSVKATITNYKLLESTPFEMPDDNGNYYVLNTNGLVGD